MSCIRKIKSFTVVKNIEVKYANKQELDKLIENIKTVVIQKLTKLNLIAKNMKVSINGCSLIVNDTYHICPEFENIVKAFNLNIKKNKDQSYLITDQFLILLIQLSESIDLNNIFKNASIDNQDIGIKSIYNSKLIEAMKKIRLTGNYSYQHKQKIKQTFYDDYPQYFEYIHNDKRNKDFVLANIKNFIENLNNKLIEANKELATGTVALIKYRAKQMGYSIKQTNNKDNTQLVLERID